MFGHDPEGHMQLRLYLKIESQILCVNELLVEQEYAIGTVESYKTPLRGSTRRHGPLTRCNKRDDSYSDTDETSDQEIKRRYNTFLASTTSDESGDQARGSLSLRRSRSPLEIKDDQGFFIL